MPSYEFSPEALNDLEIIRDFIAIENVDAAERLIRPIF
jgi:plasmid stabilization system protein ParE